MSLESEVVKLLYSEGADIVRFADVSSLPQANNGFPSAILIGMLLSREYVTSLTGSLPAGSDEFHEKESKTDQLAEDAAAFFIQKSCRAFAQSEKNVEEHGYFNSITRTSLLPHKTVAMLSGLGWIGRNNLLVTKEYGCAVSMCTVLTDAPVQTAQPPPYKSGCRGCTVCQTVCPTGAIYGNDWSKHTSRDNLIDISRCCTCLKCLAACPWTKKYASR